MSDEEILKLKNDISNNKWGWVGVKRFDSDIYNTIEEKYEGLLRHHYQETANMLCVIKQLLEKL